MKSYYRKCKHCGRRIQLRQMPAGQWVAYEGYDTIHDCNAPPSKSHSTQQRGEDLDKHKPGYDDIGFIDVNIPGGIKKSIPPPDGEMPKSSLSKDTLGFTQGSQTVDEIRDILDQAIGNLHVLTISFRNLNGKITTRDIEPSLRTNTHCIAYCRLRSDFRSFRLDGIKTASIKNEVFSPRRLLPEVQRSLDVHKSNYTAVSKNKQRGTHAWFAWVIIIIAFILFLFLINR